MRRAGIVQPCWEEAVREEAVREEAVRAWLISGSIGEWRGWISEMLNVDA
jgi:hypothetical protein